MTDRFNAKLLHLRLACVMVVGLQACSHLPSKPVATNASSTTSAAVWQPEDQMAWERVRIPGKVATQYSVVKVSNRSTLKATAQSSASMLRKDLRIEPTQLGQLGFSWQVQSLIERADMALRDQDDSPVRLVLAFEVAYQRYPTLKLHHPDGTHPGLLGTYLAACTTYASLYGRSPVGNAYRADGAIEADVALQLQQLADDVVSQFFQRKL